MRHAVDHTGSYGDAVAAAALLDPQASDVRPSPGELWTVATLRDNRRFGIWDLVPNSRATDSVPVRQHTISLSDAAESPSELVGAAKLLADDIANGFGLGELLQLDRDGRVRIGYFRQAFHTSIQRWAEARGVEWTNDSVET